MKTPRKSPRRALDLLPAPEQWCDRRCERCVLSATCPAVGDAANDAIQAEPATAQAPLTEVGAEGATTGAKGGAKRKPRRRDTWAAPTLSDRLRPYADEVVVAVKDFVGSLLADPDPRSAFAFSVEDLALADRAGAAACALADKVDLLESLGPTNPRDKAWMAKCAPTLLVLECLIDEIATSIVALQCSLSLPLAWPFALLQIQGLLNPVLKAIPRAYRREIDERVTSRHAPSPFYCKEPSPLRWDPADPGSCVGWLDDSSIVTSGGTKTIPFEQSDIYDEDCAWCRAIAEMERDARSQLN